MSNEKDPQESRIVALDGIRGIAIILVVYWHYIGWPAENTLSGLSLWIARLLAPAGWAGVDLFFVLSGYLIGSIMLKHRSSPSLARSFWIRRCARILPGYLLLLVGYFVAYHLLHSNESYSNLLQSSVPWWSYLVFSQNFFMCAAREWGPSFLGITWSLAVEEQFYLILFLLLRYLPFRAIPYVLGGVALVSIALHSTGVSLVCSVVNPLFRLYTLLFGSLIAWFHFQGVQCGRPAAFSWVAVFGWITGSYLASLGDVRTHLVLGLSGACLVFSSIGDGNGGVLSPILRNQFIGWLGRISFGIYLLHEPVSGLLHGFFLGGSPSIVSAPSLALTAVSAVITLTLAHLSYSWIESPMMRWGHKFKYA